MHMRQLLCHDSLKVHQITDQVFICAEHLIERDLKIDDKQEMKDSAKSDQAVVQAEQADKKDSDSSDGQGV